MPQQVNLYLPILRKRKESFTAQTLAQALLVILLGGALVTAAWVWNLQRASDSLQQTLQAQEKERAILQAALDAARSRSGPEREALSLQTRARLAELRQRQDVLAALNQGLLEPGRGHSDRLRLVAQTIPAAAWVKALRLDDALLDVSGFTLAPEALNEWVGKLAGSDLLKGHQLDAIKVETVQPAAVQAAGAASGVPAAPLQWSFHLVSRRASSAGAAASAPSAAASAGGRP